MTNINLSIKILLAIACVTLILIPGASSRILGNVVQCPDQTTVGCVGPPKWDIRWDMAGSGYIYCYNTCPMEWLATNRNIGVYGGVLGVDHYWTNQGMPCINGIPQEFAMQDAYALLQKQRFPRIKILQYRITDAVPYAAIVHEKMVSDPDAFVRWTHPPTNNGSICRMPYVEHKTEGFNCSWEIRAAAYDWSQSRVRQWFLDNIIKPVMKVADGAWIDGDGPDNGAWMCSGSYDHEHLPAPYPALNVDEIAAFCAGERNVTAEAQKWLLGNGGYDYNCFSFICGGALPAATDTAEACASKLVKLDHRPAPSATVLYGNRNNGCDYTDATAAQAVAVFMLTRAEYWFFGYPGADTLNKATAALLLSDFGTPLGNMVRPDPTKYVFQRKYQKATVSFDCATFSADFIMNE